MLNLKEIEVNILKKLETESDEVFSKWYTTLMLEEAKENTLQIQEFYSEPTFKNTSAVLIKRIWFEITDNDFDISLNNAA